MKERIRSKTIKSFPLTPTTLGVLPLCLVAYPTETHQFLLLCWKRPKKHLKLASHPLGWEGFTTCLQGSPGGQGRGRGVLLSLVGEQRTEPQSSCPSVWPRGRRQNILSLGPNDISSPRLCNCALWCDLKALMELLLPSLSLPSHLLFCIFSEAVGNFHNQA